MKALDVPGLPPPFGAYSHGVRAGDVIVTSGQLALTADGQVPEGARAQARLILSNIDALLAAGGLGRRDVLRLNAYVTAREHMAGYMAARDEWVADLDPLPASTLMIVSGFTRSEFVVEIEALALRRAP